MVYFPPYIFMYKEYLVASSTIILAAGPKHFDIFLISKSIKEKLLK